MRNKWSRFRRVRGFYRSSSIFPKTRKVHFVQKKNVIKFRELRFFRIDLFGNAWKPRPALHLLLTCLQSNQLKCEVRPKVHQNVLYTNHFLLEDNVTITSLGLCICVNLTAASGKLFKSCQSFTLQAVQNERAPRAIFHTTFNEEVEVNKYGPRGSVFRSHENKKLISYPLNFPTNFTSTSVLGNPSLFGSPVSFHAEDFEANFYSSTPRQDFKQKFTYYEISSSVLHINENFKKSLQLNQKPDYLPGNTTDNEVVFELAAKLLFFTVKWVKALPCFGKLHKQSQYFLLRNSWAELFLLMAIYWRLPFEGVISDKRIKSVKTAIDQFNTLNVDSQEFACLKMLTLFKPICDEREYVIHLRDQTIRMLCAKTGGFRLGHLLLILPLIKDAANPAVIQDIFFKTTVGNVTIERLLGDMMKS